MSNDKVTGIFGMAAHSVSKRLKELGIRMALGAQNKGNVTGGVGTGIPAASESHPLGSLHVFGNSGPSGNDYARAYSWKGNTIHQSEMALFFECRL